MKAFILVLYYREIFSVQNFIERNLISEKKGIIGGIPHIRSEPQTNFLTKTCLFPLGLVSRRGRAPQGLEIGGKSTQPAILFVEKIWGGWCFSGQKLK